MHARVHNLTCTHAHAHAHAHTFVWGMDEKGWQTLEIRPANAKNKSHLKNMTLFFAPHYNFQGYVQFIDEKKQNSLFKISIWIYVYTTFLMFE